MGKSLLSSFTEDFNATIELKSFVSGKDSIGQTQNTYVSYATGVKCLLLRNKKTPYDNFAGGDVEYIKTTHKLRMETAYDVQEGDKVIDAVSREYEVKFVEQSPGFGGEPDHMLLFIDRIKNVGTNIGGN